MTGILAPVSAREMVCDGSQCLESVSTKVDSSVREEFVLRVSEAIYCVIHISSEPIPGSSQLLSCWPLKSELGAGSLHTS